MDEITLTREPAKEKPQAPTDRKSVEEWLRHLLRRGLYEDSDFCVTNEYITVDMCYDSKSYVKSYRDQIKARYPRHARFRGTKVTIHFEG